MIVCSFEGNQDQLVFHAEYGWFMARVFDLARRLLLTYQYGRRHRPRRQVIDRTHAYTVYVLYELANRI